MATLQEENERRMNERTKGKRGMRLTLAGGCGVAPRGVRATQRPRKADQFVARVAGEGGVLTRAGGRVRDAAVQRGHEGGEARRGLADRCGLAPVAAARRQKPHRSASATKQDIMVLTIWCRWL